MTLKKKFTTHAESKTHTAVAYMCTQHAEVGFGVWSHTSGLHTPPHTHRSGHACLCAQHCFCVSPGEHRVAAVDQIRARGPPRCNLIQLGVYGAEKPDK